MISAYCLSYGNWTVIPSHWERVFADMKENGFDAVALSFSESEERYSMRTFEQQVLTAQRNGLKALAIPSRIGGRFAGAPFMQSPWLAAHPESQLPGHPELACLEEENFLRRTEEFLRYFTDDFGVDGLIWDEPKGVDVISTHPATLAKYGPNPSGTDMHHSMLDYLTHITSFVKKRDPDLNITLFNMPNVPEAFTRESAKIPGLDFVGFDGRCCKESYFHEPAIRNKAYIRDLWPRIRSESAAAPGSFALMENILIPDEAFDEFRQEFTLALDTIEPDHLSIYYYGHNNESAERVQRFCMDSLKTYIKNRKRRTS